jgi:hypothetical protein
VTVWKLAELVEFLETRAANGRKGVGVKRKKSAKDSDEGGRHA